MRKEIDKFWEMIKNENTNIQEKGFRSWAKFNEKFPDYILNFKKIFLKDFYDEYKTVNLHDFQVKEVICSLKAENKTEIKIHLFDYYNDFKENIHIWLVYKGVSEHKIDLKSSVWETSWGNDVIYALNENNYKYRIILNEGSNIDVVFNRLEVAVEKGEI